MSKCRHDSCISNWSYSHMDFTKNLYSKAKAEKGAMTS